MNSPFHRPGGKPEVPPTPPPLPASPASLERRATRWLLPVLIAVLAGALVLLATVAGLAWMLTRPAAPPVGQAVSQRARPPAFALSDSTRNLLRQLDTPIEIRFYFSKTESHLPPAFRDYGEVISDVLGEYQRQAAGRLTLKSLNPRPDTPAEDEAQKDGMETQQLEEGTRIYCGLAVHCGTNIAALPMMLPSRESLLEYDVTRCLQRVLANRKPVLGILSSLPIWGETNTLLMAMAKPRSDAEPWTFLSELKKDFDVRRLESNLDRIDPAIDVLLAVHPKEFPPATQYALDQFVLRGGRLLLLLDPLAIVDRPASATHLPVAPAASSVPDQLLKAWGVRFETNRVAADLTFATTVNQGGKVEKHPAFLSIGAAGIATNEVLTGGVESLLFPHAGVFHTRQTPGLQEAVLVKTTPQSQLVDTFIAQLAGAKMLEEFKASGEGYPLALRLTGKFPTAFPEGPPALPGRDPAPGLKECREDNTVILVGDADFISDLVAVRVQNLMGQKVVIPNNGNLAFLNRALEYLAANLDIPPTPSLTTEKRWLRHANRPRVPLPPAATMDEITRSVTNLLAMPVEDGVRILEQQSQQEYQAVLGDLDRQLNEAQRRISELQTNKTGTQNFTLNSEQQEALKAFQNTRQEQKEKLKKIRRRLRAQIEALEQLNGITNQPASDGE